VTKINFELIREKVREGDYEISVHATERMRRRGITLDDVENAIINGEIIERDSRARPFPKCIFWGFTVLKGESIHVVCSIITLIRNGINCTIENSRPPYARFGCSKWPFVNGSSQFSGRSWPSRERIGSSKFQLCYYLEGVQRSCYHTSKQGGNDLLS